MGSAARTALALGATGLLFFETWRLIVALIYLIDNEDFSIELLIALAIIVGCIAAIRSLRGAGFAAGAGGACAAFYGILLLLEESLSEMEFLLGVLLVILAVASFVYASRHRAPIGAGGARGSDLKGGLQGVVRRLKEEGGTLSFWLQSQNGEQIPVEARIGGETIREGDVVWVKGGRSRDGILRTSEIRNLRTSPPVSTGMPMSQQAPDSSPPSQNWLQDQTTPPEIPKFEKSKKDETVTGTARNVKMSSQEKRSKSLLEKWWVQGDVYAWVQRFRVEVTDQEGNIMEVVPVEVWAKEIHGEVAEGDQVHVEGKKEHGVLKAKRVYDKTTNSELRIKS